MELKPFISTTKLQKNNKNACNVQIKELKVTSNIVFCQISNHKNEM